MRSESVPRHFRRKSHMISEAAHTLIVNAFQEGDTSGLREFCERAKGSRAKEIVGHFENYLNLKKRDDELLDGDEAVEPVCDAIAAEEDWFQAQLGWSA
jgi:hypothetical protein